jgi:hypothetical protein
MGDLSPEDQDRLLKYREAWNFYEGYHWENIPLDDKPQITENYCRAFVNKFVAFEMGMGFTIKMPIEDDASEETGTPITDFLNEVWKNNSKQNFCINLGQMKSITGDGWIQVKYEPKGNFSDPFGEYPDGRIRVLVVPSSTAFPVYDIYDKDKLVKLTIAYPIERETKSPVLQRTKVALVPYKQIWTEQTIEVWEGNDRILSVPNPYGIIPFVHVSNFPIAGRNFGLSDLEDIIPLNVELNLKKSDISEIIDYHSAPVTVVYGAKIGSLEKGANKIWGGLPKDAKVQNLELNSDLGASTAYVDSLKSSMHQIGGIPEGALGGEQAISNTSGVALQILNMPLIERIRIKRMGSIEGLQQVNKIILLIANHEGLITMPSSMKPKDFYNNEVSFPDPLPKDRLLELQQIQLEMQLAIEDRYGAMDRLGEEDIKNKIVRVDKDREDNPLAYGIQPVSNTFVDNPEIDPNKPNPQPQVNSGVANGQTPVEQVRKEMTGQNGGTKS